MQKLGKGGNNGSAESSFGKEIPQKIGDAERHQPGIVVESGPEELRKDLVAIRQAMEAERLGPETREPRSNK